METNNIKNNDKKKPSRLKYIIAAGITLFVIVLIFGIMSWQYEPDPASEELIRYNVAKALNKDIGNLEALSKLTDEDFAQITRFRINPIEEPIILISGYHPEINLADIRVLKKFTNLQEFGLIFAKYPKEKVPKWMEILDSYGILDLEDRLFIDLKPLENLKHLKMLNFIGSDIKNIEPLANLKNLEYLELSDTKVSNIKPLKKLRNLKYLYIINCDKIPRKQIEDLQKALPELKIVTTLGEDK